jgi:hypothetical protein
MSTSRRVAVVFVHGLAKKPPPEKLKEIWLWGLSRGNPMPTVFKAPNEGLNLAAEGIPSSFNYYADVFYGADYESNFDSYYEADVRLEISSQGLDRVEAGLVPPKAITPREQAFLRDFEVNLLASLQQSRAGTLATARLERASELEIAAWLPDSVIQAIIKKAAMEAYYFLFDKEFVRADGVRFMVRKELRRRLLEQLAAAKAQADTTVVVSHSMGTMVAYDVLRNCPECPSVDTLFTLGSPLGVTEVQDELRASDAASVDFPADKLTRWVNVFDPLDPICGADPRLSNDYLSVSGKSVEDVKESNWGSWRHTITHYFAGTAMRAKLAAALGVLP